MNAEEIIARLDARDLRPKSTGPGKWEAHCPAHDDGKPSLAIVTGSEASTEHAAMRIAWASKALVAAAVELHELGATGAGEALADDAERVGRRAAEIERLAKA